MVTIQHRTTIDRRPNDVFAYVADTTNDPAWHTDLVEVRRTDTGPIGLDSEFEVRIKPFMGQTTGSLRVTGHEPDSRFELRGRMGPISPTIGYTFRPSNGGTEVSRTVAVEWPGVMRLVQVPLRPILARRNARFLANLKQVLER